jgi:hypothetical protein
MIRKIHWEGKRQGGRKREGGMEGEREGGAKKS